MFLHPAWYSMKNAQASAFLLQGLVVFAARLRSKISQACKIHPQHRALWGEGEISPKRPTNVLTSVKQEAFTDSRL